MGIKDRYKVRYLFILGHMRGYTSLLAHILGSHPEISGYSELKLSYNSRQDLESMSRKIGELQPQYSMRRYQLDKIVENEYTISMDILNSPDVCVIFMLRHPESTIKSSLSFMYGDSLTERFVKAVAVYQSRISKLEKYANKLEKSALFVPSESLIQNTTETFLFLETELDLKTKLSEDYSVFPYTGIPGYSDSSTNILAGKIIRSNNSSDVTNLTGSLGRMLLKQYQDLREMLLSKCRFPKLYSWDV